MVAARRIVAFLDSPELDVPKNDIRTLEPARDGRGAVLLKDVTVWWEQQSAKPTLHNLNLEAGHGEL